MLTLNKIPMKKILLAILLAFSFAGNAQTWTTQATGFTNPNRTLNSISIVNANIIWANEFDAANQDYTLKTFTRTTTGGNSWTTGSIYLGASTTDLGISSITAVSASTAWVSVFPDAIPTTQLGGIWKTTDGGATWEKQASALYSSADSYANFVHFWDALNGVAVGDPVNGEFEIYTTTNGGANWTIVTDPTNLAPITDELGYFNSYSVSGDSFWFGTSKGRIFKSTNKGLTWTVTQSPGVDQNSDFTFSTPLKGLLMKFSTGAPYELYSTANGGENWSLVNAPTGNFYKTDIAYIPGTSNIIASASQTPYSSRYSNDDGLTWTTIDTGVFHGTLAFLNVNVGFSAGVNTDATTGGIFKFSPGTLKTSSFNLNNQIAAYPNPTNGLLQINAKESLVKEATVYDLLGKKVYSSKISPSSNTSLDLKSLQNGIYNLKVTSDTGKIENIKIMKN